MNSASATLAARIHLFMQLNAITKMILDCVPADRPRDIHPWPLDCRPAPPFQQRAFSPFLAFVSGSCKYSRSGFAIYVIMLRTYNDKVDVITGAASTLGRALATFIQ